jgi:D-hydroxyproline dehydrogenase subunit beta
VGIARKYFSRDHQGRSNHLSRQQQRNIAIVGAGILGLAHAYAFARRGHKVRVYERHPRASGASIRNFGMLWPIGQPAGLLCDLAMDSRKIWLEILREAELPHWPTGSLHLAYREDEEAVAREFAELSPDRAMWINRDATLEKSPAAAPEGLRGALYSDHEIVVDPRRTLAILPAFLAEKYGVTFHFGTAVTNVARLEADQVFICSGDDFETLYPDVFANSGVTRCKLQMMRTEPQPDGWSLGPALAGGLTLRFYQSFKICSTLDALEKRIASEMPEYNKWGIHVMASQNADGRITIGDSHEYGLAVDIFNKDEIDRLILDYLRGMARFPEMRIAERWHGVYARHFDRPFFYEQPEPEVYIVTASAGKGMTVSFGLAEMLYENPSRNF